MRRIAFIFWFLLQSLSDFAQTNHVEEDQSTFSLQLNQDNTFNFYPVIFGSIPLQKNDLTFYANFWTTPVFANPDGTGSLIEVGIGLGLAVKGNLYVNPTLGFAHGIFTNGRNQMGQGRPTIGDAIVPGLTCLFKNKKLEIEFFSAIYKNFRQEVSPSSDYLFFWLLPGIRFNDIFSTGLHYEQFRDIKNGIGTYTRYGLYGKATFKKKYELRMSGGFNYTPDTNNKIAWGDFYKLTVNIPF